MRKSARYAGSGWTRTKSCGLGLRIGISVISFLTPARFDEILRQSQRFQVERIRGFLGGGFNSG